MMFRQCLVRTLFLGLLLVLGVPSQWARADVITSGDTGTPNVAAWLAIGNTADGTMTIDGGSSVASPDGGGVGLTEGVTGGVTITGTGSSWTVGGGDGGNIHIGGCCAEFFSPPGGTGVVTVENGGQLIVNGASFGEFLLNTPHIFLGREGGTGTLNILAGGRVVLQDLALVGGGEGINIGGSAFSNDVSQGTLVVEGTGARLDVIGNDTFINVGRAGVGNMSVSDGGIVNLDADNLGTGILVGRHAATGTLTLSNGRINIRGAIGTSAEPFMTIGREPDSVGVLTLENSSVISLIGHGGWGAEMVVGKEGNGTVNVSGGSQIQFVGNDGIFPGMLVGQLAGSTGTLNVFGTGSTITVSGNAAAGSKAGWIVVGRDGATIGRLNITEGGVVQNTPGGISVVGRRTDSDGRVFVDGAASRFDGGGLLVIGADFDTDTDQVLLDSFGTGVVRANNGGTVEADQIIIGPGGNLGGNGTVTGEVINKGGVVEPGASPGTLTVEGSFTQEDGTLKIEVAGTASGQFDVLTVNGTADLTGGGIEVKFVDGFVPSVGDSFTILTSLGATLAPEVTAVIDGVARNLRLNLSQVGNNLVVTVLVVTVETVAMPWLKLLLLDD